MLFVCAETFVARVHISELVDPAADGEQSIKRKGKGANAPPSVDLEHYKKLVGSLVSAKVVAVELAPERRRKSVSAEERKAPRKVLWMSMRPSELAVTGVSDVKRITDVETLKPGAAVVAYVRAVTTDEHKTIWVDVAPDISVCHSFSCFAPFLSRQLILYSLSQGRIRGENISEDEKVLSNLSSKSIPVWSRDISSVLIFLLCLF